MRNAKWLILGLSFSLLSCGTTKKLGITETCIVDASTGSATCFYKDNSQKEKTIEQMDKYTCHSPDNAQKILNYVHKALKAGVRP